MNRIIKDMQLLSGAQRKPFFVKKSETLWKCRETKIGRLFIGAKCDTLQIRVSDGCFCKKHLVIKEPRRNGKNDLEQV